MGNTGKQGEKKEPEDGRARKRVEEVVPRHIKQWAAAAGVRPTDQFQEDVTEALHAFMRAHCLGPRRRWSTVRTAFSVLADDYRALSKLLGHWESGRDLPPEFFVYPQFKGPQFEDLPQLMPPPLLRAALKPLGNAAKFRELTKAARKYAEACAPEGGGLRSPFDVLCGGDAVSFGLSVRWNVQRKNGVT